MIKRLSPVGRVLCIALLAAPLAVACGVRPSSPAKPAYVVEANIPEFGQVVCVTAGPVTAWRVVEVTGRADYRAGVACPAGHVAGSSSCTLDSNGNYTDPYDGDGVSGYAQGMASQVCSDRS